MRIYFHVSLAAAAASFSSSTANKVAMYNNYNIIYLPPKQDCVCE